MSYNTAHSPFGFLLQQGIMVLYTIIFLTISVALIFMVAESLSRRAFGHHMQFWRLFNPQFASTYTVLGSTLSGYILVPMMLCYTVLFYVFTMNWLGWWNPSQALFNPNILATYFPWLESISLSLQAGFLEECLFRAIPLASAALLGTYFGKRSWWIAGAFILQAFVFGAAHANYPAQPAYARLVELLADSALFGGIYLWLGLLPAIITHFIYDVFWFALPIFISTAPGALANKIIIVLLALIPLFIVLYARIKEGSWHYLQPSMLNESWRPLEQKVEIKKEFEPIQTIHVKKTTIYGICVLGILGLAAWVLTERFTDDAPRFSISKVTAHQKSKELSQEKKIDLSAWYPLVFPFVHYNSQADLQKQHRFIWQEGGKKIYNQLIGAYLTPPHWITRLVKFDGPIMERAEEHQIYLKPDGSFLRYTHTLPETRPGASLSKKDAQKLALATIADQFGSTPAQLHEVSAVSEKQPERLDWVLTYSSTTDYPLAKGEARIMVKLGGDQVIDAYRYIHVPEKWERNEENRLLFANIINQLCKLFIYLIAMIGAVIAFLSWRIGNPLSFLGLFGIFTTIFLFELINSWPAVLANFNTSQPFYDQIFRSFTIAPIFLTLRAAALAVMFGFVTQTYTRYRVASLWASIPTGMALGALLAGMQSIIISVIPPLEPLWANFTPMRFLLPFTAGVNSMILNYFSLTILLLLCIICMNKITHYGQQRILLGAFISLLAGYIGAGLLFADNLSLFGASGFFFALLFYGSYYALLRFDRAIIPITTATYLILENVQEFFFNGYPAAALVTISSSIVLALIALIWAKKLQKS